MSGFLWRRLSADDEGISLVEVLVSVVILAVVLAATLSTLIATFGAVRSTEAHVRATALSNELLESMASIQWDRLGLYVDEVGSSTYEGQAVALLPVETPRDPLVPPPTETLNRDGRDYSVTRWVTWVDDGTGQDYKRLVVELGWTVGDHMRTMRTESFRAPNPNEFVDLTVELTEVVNDSTGGDEIALNAGTFTNAERIRLMVDVNYADAVVEISFIDRMGVRRPIGVPGPGLQRVPVYVNAGQYAFPNGPISFAVTARTGAPRNETASNTQTLTVYQPVAIGEPNITHASGRDPICVDASGQPVDPATLTVDIEGVTAADAIAEDLLIRYDGKESLLDPVATTLGGGRFAANLVGPLPTGSLEVTVVATRVATDPAYSAQVELDRFFMVTSADQVPAPC